MPALWRCPDRPTRCSTIRPRDDSPTQRRNRPAPRRPRLGLCAARHRIRHDQSRDRPSLQTNQREDDMTGEKSRHRPRSAGGVCPCAGSHYEVPPLRRSVPLRRSSPLRRSRLPRTLGSISTVRRWRPERRSEPRGARLVIFLLPDNDASERAEPPVRGGIIHGMCGRGCTGSSEPSCPVLGPTAKPRTLLGRSGHYV